MYIISLKQIHFSSLTNIYTELIITTVLTLFVLKSKFTYPKINLRLARSKINVKLIRSLAIQYTNYSRNGIRRVLNRNENEKTPRLFLPPSLSSLK